MAFGLLINSSLVTTRTLYIHLTLADVPLEIWGHYAKCIIDIK